MRTVAILALFLCRLTGHSQTVFPSWAQERFKKFIDRYRSVDYIKPSYLEADFSGDDRSDIAVLIERKADTRKGILILFRQTDQSFILGAGTNFGSGGDNFDWADMWGVFSEKTTHETTFDKNGDVAGGKERRLERCAIQIREDEGSGGLIYFDGKKFVWIHQGD
jgi:hypothetical protein